MHTPFAARGRRENAPSSFVPLQQPKYRSSRDRESVRDSMSRNEGSLSVQTPESTHAVKVLDESWNWTSRGSDVGGVRKGCGSLNNPAVLWWRSCLLTCPSNSLACPLCLHYLYPPPPSSTLPLPFDSSSLPLLSAEPHGAARLPGGRLSRLARGGQVHCHVHSGRQPDWLWKVRGGEGLLLLQSVCV